MLSKNEAKYIQSLYHKKTREAEGVFVVEGPKMLEELAGSAYEVRKIFATDAWVNTGNINAEVVRVDEASLQRISALQTANEVLAIVAQQQTSAGPVLEGNLTLVLDQVQDPGNLGTIIRIADWFGIRQIIASEHTVELYNPKVIQSTMGSFVRVNVWYKDLATILSQATVPVFGALLNGQSVFETGRVAAGLLLIGNESKGISESLKPLITHPVTIPRMGGAESLNAAVATGIILSHLVK